MNKGYDKNGYITDVNKLSSFDAKQYNNAIEALDNWCYNNGFDGIDETSNVRLDGSHVFGEAIVAITIADEEHTIPVYFSVDFYGKLSVTGMSSLLDAYVNQDGDVKVEFIQKSGAKFDLPPTYALVYIHLPTDGIISYDDYYTFDAAMRDFASLPA